MLSTNRNATEYDQQKCNESRRAASVRDVRIEGVLGKHEFLGSEFPTS